MKRRGLLESASGSEQALSQIGEILLIANWVEGAVVDKCRGGAQKPFLGRLASEKAPRDRLSGVGVAVLEHDEACCHSGLEGTIEVCLGNNFEGIKTHACRIARNSSQGNSGSGSAPRPLSKGAGGATIEGEA